MNRDLTATEPLRELPSDVNQRLRFWHGLWHRSSMYHYFFGVVSVAASVISTSLEGQPAKYFSIVAAIATSMIGFMHPERRYMKFVRAWRVLDVASMRYRHGLIDKPQLIDAVEKGEALIAEFEERIVGAAETDPAAKPEPAPSPGADMGGGELAQPAGEGATPRP